MFPLFIKKVYKKCQCKRPSKDKGALEPSHLSEPPSSVKAHSRVPSKFSNKTFEPTQSPSTSVVKNTIEPTRIRSIFINKTVEPTLSPTPDRELPWNSVPNTSFTAFPKSTIFPSMSQASQKPNLSPVSIPSQEFQNQEALQGNSKKSMVAIWLGSYICGLIFIVVLFRLKRRLRDKGLKNLIGNTFDSIDSEAPSVGSKEELGDDFTLDDDDISEDSVDLSPFMPFNVPEV